MSQAAVETAADTEQKLPRRDWILLPLIAVITVAFLVAASEVVARVVWPEQMKDACYVPHGPHGGHFLPNCTSKTKTAEGPWVVNSYNSCGYRSKESCGPKPDGAIRVAVLGSSYSYGYSVPYNDTYTTLTGQLLKRECKRPVEFQNLGVLELPLEDVYQRTGEALELKPDVLLLSIFPFDIAKFTTFNPDASTANDAPDARQAKKNVQDWVRNDIVTPLKSSRSFTMLQHYMYQNPDTYVWLYLSYGDAADYLRTPFSPLWQKRLANLDTMLRLMSEKSQAASVPMMILVGPTEAQAALVNLPPRERIDPQALESEIARIAAKYGIATINPLPKFAGQSHPMDMFYTVDGHTGPRGQRVVADAVNDALLAGKLPAFAGCAK